MKTMPSPASCCWVSALGLPFSKHHCLRKLSHPFLWRVRSQARERQSSPSSSTVVFPHTSPAGGCALAQPSIPETSREGQQLTHPRSCTAPVFPIHCGYTCYLKADPANKLSQLTARGNSNSNISNGTICSGVQISYLCLSHGLCHIILSVCFLSHSG